VNWLNYHHLLYFWVVAREGSIRRASEELHLASPTISKQLKQLESSLGGRLFDHAGRNLVLTEFGQSVYRYADEIFAVGKELQDALRGAPAGRPVRFIVGMPDVLPKLIAYRLLKPAFDLPHGVQVICREGKHDELFADLALHRIDLVLSDSPLPPTAHIRAFNHLLGECSVTFFGTRSFASKYRRRFPMSLNGAPVLLPAEATAVRREIDRWSHDCGLYFQIVAEFQDSALMKVFGQDGVGIFPGPTAVEKQICRQYGVQVLGRVDAVRERFYAISVERKLKHPGVLAIRESARHEIFAAP